jgi:hypothetical protein
MKQGCDMFTFDTLSNYGCLSETTGKPGQCPGGFGKTTDTWMGFKSINRYADATGGGKESYSNCQQVLDGSGTYVGGECTHIDTLEKYEDTLETE